MTTTNDNNSTQMSAIGSTDTQVETAKGQVNTAEGMSIAPNNWTYPNGWTPTMSVSEPQFETVKSKRSLKKTRPSTSGPNVPTIKYEPESEVDHVPNNEEEEPWDKVKSFRDLAKSSIQTWKAEEPETSNIGNAMEFVFGIMKDYAVKVPIGGLTVHYDAEFIEYIHPKSRRFFTRVANYDVDETKTKRNTGCGRHIMSLWSWYMGKSNTGRPIFVYICTNEEYNCDGGEHREDPVVNSCDYLEFQRTALNEVRMLRDAAPDGQAKNDAKRVFAIQAAQIREQMDGNVCQTFTRLEFFATFKEAKRFITDRAVVKVDFGINKKKTYPKFQYQEESFPEFRSTGKREEPEPMPNV